MRKFLMAFGSVLGMLLVFGLIGCTISQSTAATSQAPAMTFTKIGTEGSTVLITLVSPSIDTISTQDLANRLRQDWRNATFPGINPGHVQVQVFDNTDAPTKMMSNWQAMATMSDQNFATFWAPIGPHKIAIYDENTTTGLEQVTILDRTADCNVVQTITFK
jgi:hypothetical protein